MDWSFANNLMRDIVACLQTPVVVILLFLLAAAIVFVGVAIVEYFVERRHLTADVPQLADAIERSAGVRELRGCIAGSGLLASQRAALDELTRHPGLDASQREALAVELLEAQQSRYELRLTWTELIARLAPMFGLMGTLIPLGPGLIALGLGDTSQLSAALLIAFDTTVVGLVAGVIGMCVSTARRRWYSGYQSMLEALEECVLARLADGEGDDAR